MGCIVIVAWMHKSISFIGCIFYVNLVVCSDLEFEDNQKAHQRSQRQILLSAHRDIIEIITRVYNTFSNDGPEVCALFYW